MPSFVKRRKSTENPAGGVNPALEPNVGQYGWTSYDAANVNQIIQYVDLCKKYAEEAKDAADYIKTTYEGLKDLIIYLEEIYGKIKPIADNIESMYIDVSRWHKEVMVARIEVDLDRIKAAESAAGAKLSEETAIEAATSAFRSKIAAKDSEDQSLIYLEESRGLAEELRQGQVYRGTWNPKTAAWPDNGGTNSVWDVILDAGTSSIDYGGFTWNAGDRLLYIVAETKYDQLKTGSGVLSVNGKAGAVTITLDELGGLPASGNPTVNGNLTISGNLTVRGNEIEMANLNVIGDLSERNYRVYTEGRKPAPQEIGAIPDTATINGKPVNTNPTITLAELGGYPISGGSLNGPIVLRDVIRVNSAANPIMELHAEGTTAAMLWIDKSNNYLNLSRSNGASVEVSRLMSFLENGVSKFYNALESTTTIIARSFNGQKYIAFESHDNANPYISFDSADGGGARIGIAFDGKEIAFSQRPAAGDMRVGNNGGLKFSPFADLAGISWGMGMDPTDGVFALHQYSSGTWQQAPIQINPGNRSTHIVNTLYTGNHQIKIGSGQIPAQEFLIQGQHAVMWYLNPANGAFHLATTGGNFDASHDRLVITSSSELVSSSRIITNYSSGRTWTAWGANAFYGQVQASATPGTLNGLIGRPLQNPGHWGLEQYIGSYSQDNSPENHEHILCMNDGSGWYRPWRLSNYGNLYSPGFTVGGGMPWWTMSAAGMLTGTAWGGQLDGWVATYYQPISDAKFKENIKPATKSALNDVKQIQFKAFDWKDGHDIVAHRDSVEIGMIAQELENLCVSYTIDVPVLDDEGKVTDYNKSLDTASLLSLALKAIQELEERVAILEGRP